MTTHHTPGEWHLSDNNREDMHVRAGAKGFVIAEVNSQSAQFIGNQREAQANAQLIASAPELLSALTALLKERTPETIDQAQAVILKATGNKVSVGGNTTTPIEHAYNGTVTLPAEVMAVLDSLTGDEGYEGLKAINDKLKPLGYWIRHGLDAQVIDIVRIGGTYTPDQHTIEDFERMADKLNDQQGSTEWRAG